MPFLLESWPEIAARLRRSPSVALFLDFDGTLSPIAPHPEDASLERRTRAVLSRLAGNPRIKVCVISGRRRADLLARVAVPGLDYLGVHGSETGGNGFSTALLSLVAEARKGLVSRLNGMLHGTPNGTGGVLVEDKGASFALHYRGAGGQAAGRARELLDQTLQETLTSHGETLRVIDGDRVWEVLPGEVRGKGDAVRKHWRRYGVDALPVYLGNDATDESAFQALASGVTARVGRSQRSRAHYRLRNPAEVRRFLEKLEQAM